jgi:hypothetical protein
MSSEQLENTNNNLEHDKLIRSKNTHRVDINHLMFKIRENESKAKKENLFLFILVFSIILSVGLVLSF